VIPLCLYTFVVWSVADGYNYLLIVIANRRHRLPNPAPRKTPLAGVQPFLALRPDRPLILPVPARQASPPFDHAAIPDSPAHRRRPQATAGTRAAQKRGPAASQRLASIERLETARNSFSKVPSIISLKFHSAEHGR